MQNHGFAEIIPVVCGKSILQVHPNVSINKNSSASHAFDLMLLQSDLMQQHNSFNNINEELISSSTHKKQFNSGNEDTLSSSLHRKRFTQENADDTLNLLKRTKSENQPNVNNYNLDQSSKCNMCYWSLVH